MGEGRVRAREAPAEAFLQGLEQYPKDAITELNTIFNDAHAFVLVSRGPLLKDATSVSGCDAPPESYQSRLSVRPEGDREALLMRDTERPEELDGQVCGRILIRAFPWDRAGPHGSRLTVLSDEDCRRMVLCFSPHESVIEKDLGHRRRLLVGGGSPMRGVI